MTTIAEELEKLWEHNRALLPTPPPRKVVVTRAGPHYKARYAGEDACCFGETPQEATQRLKHLTERASARLKGELP